MEIKQLSIFIENQKGHLAALTDVLNRENIDIRAISVFDTSEYGILRMVVDFPDRALKVLEKEGFTAKISDVLAIEPEDKPGSLCEVFKILDKNNIDIEYIYSFVLRKEEMPLIILKVNHHEKGVEALQNAGIKVVSKEAVYR